MNLSKNAQKRYDSQLFIASDNYCDKDSIPTINESTAKSLGLTEEEMTLAVKELAEFIQNLDLIS